MSQRAALEVAGQTIQKLIDCLNRWMAVQPEILTERQNAIAGALNVGIVAQQKFVAEALAKMTASSGSKIDTGASHVGDKVADKAATDAAIAAS